MKDREPQSGPPRWADKMLRLVLREEDRDAISGDLLEEHRDIEGASGRGAANRRYFGQTASVVAMEARRRLSWKLLFAAFSLVLVAVVQSLASARPPVIPLREPWTVDERVFLLQVAVGLFLVIAGTSIACSWFVFLTMKRRHSRTVRRTRF